MHNRYMLSQEPENGIPRRRPGGMATAFAFAGVLAAGMIHSGLREKGLGEYFSDAIDSAPMTQVLLGTDAPHKTIDDYYAGIPQMVQEIAERAIGCAPSNRGALMNPLSGHICSIPADQLPAEFSYTPHLRQNVDDGTRLWVKDKDVLAQLVRRHMEE